MITLSSQQLKEKISSYIGGVIDANDLSAWAVAAHLQYEKGSLELIDGNEKKMLDIIINLTFVNEKNLADTKHDLIKIIEQLD